MRHIILFILSVQLCYGQGHEINGPALNPVKPVNIDSLAQLIIGDWYLSGTSYYESEYSEGEEIYISAKEVFLTRITKDSILFIPPAERFYRRPVEGYKYTIRWDELMNRVELTAYREHRKKKSDFKYFSIEHSNGELRMKEALRTNGFESQYLSACSKYRPTYDSIHLEEKLIGNWQTGRILGDKELIVNDTLTFYKDSYESYHFSGIHLKIEINKGIFSGSIEQYKRIPNDQNTDGGIVDGVNVRSISDCSVVTSLNTLILQNEYEKCSFSIVSCNEDSLTLILLEKLQIKSYGEGLNYRRD